MRQLYEALRRGEIEFVRRGVTQLLLRCDKDLEPLEDCCGSCGRVRDDGHAGR